MKQGQGFKGCFQVSQSSMSLTKSSVNFQKCYVSARPHFHPLPRLFKGNIRGTPLIWEKTLKTIYIVRVKISDFPAHQSVDSLKLPQFKSFSQLVAAQLAPRLPQHLPSFPIMALVGAPAFTVVTPTVVTPLEQIPRAQGTSGTSHGVSGTGAGEIRGALR